MASQLFYAVAILCALSNGVVGQFTDQSCVNLLPLGGGNPAAGSNFFSIPGVVNPVYMPGTEINAFLANLGGVDTFQNVIIQARRQDGSTDAVGTFTEQSGLSLLSCPGSAGGTLVANGNDATVINLRWVTDVPVGPITIIATYIDSSGGLFQQTLDIDGPAPPPPDIVTIDSCPDDSVGPNPVIPNLFCRLNGNIFGLASCDQPDDFPPGETTVTCTCAQGALSDSCEFVVRVGDGITIECPADIRENDPTAVSIPNVFCRRSGTIFSLASCNQPGVFPIGQTTVTCTCTQGALSESCQFRVTVDGEGSCNPNQCVGGNECRVAATQAGYTCHSSAGLPCV